MRISFLCSDPDHPVNEWLERWKAENEFQYMVEIQNKKELLSGGDLLFLISCDEVITKKDREKYCKTLVLHASDLPKGRGWSPHVWELLKGATSLTLSLLEAEDKVDTGAIWKKTVFDVPKYALWNEINNLLFQAEIELINYAVQVFPNPTPETQEQGLSYYRKRNPKDSQIDPHQSIESQFNKIRVCDPNRFPAYFELYGKKFKLILEKLDE